MQKLRHLGFILLFLSSQFAFAAETPVDTTLKPADTDEEISPVFKDMGVVQKKSMDKAKKLLFSNYISMDFSDGPYSNYGFNFDPGYSFSDFWEVYLNVTPFYSHTQRSIVDLVHGLTLAGGQQASITSPKAQHQFGGSVYWLPLYGKDSFGSRHVVHSDTFLNFGLSQISYESGDNGMHWQLGAGKTYFVGDRAGVRFSVSWNYIQTIVNSVKSYKSILMADIGYVLYLF